MQDFEYALTSFMPSGPWPVGLAVVACLVLACLLAGSWVLLRRSERERRQYSELVDNLSDGIYRSSPEGRQLRANKALVAMNGYSSEAELLAGVTDIGKEWYVEPGRRHEFREILQRDGKVEDFVSEIYRHKSRERIWVSESARLVRDEKSGDPLFYEGSVREITDTVKRLSAEAKLQKLTRELPVSLFQFTKNADGMPTVNYLSHGYAHLTGMTPAELYANPRLFSELVIAEDRETYYATFQASEASLQPWDHEFRLQARGGPVRWVHLLARPEASADGITWHGYLADISERKRQELEIEELAYFDALTRLPNRRMFLRRMAQASAGCQKRSDHGALLFVDLDNFKTLNDTQGHDVGDRYLVEVADRLRFCVSDKDMVARIGGDEFVVILEQPGQSRAEVIQEAITIAGRLLSVLRGTFKLGALHHSGSASIGIVAFDGKESSADEILKRADLAMYEAKAAGRNGMALFDPATMDREAERYQLLGDLRAAFANGQLELHYQPQFDHNRVITGAEALLRWSHPAHGFIAPETIVRMATQFGLAAELAAFVLERGLKMLARFQSDPSTAHLRMALNMNLQAVISDAFLVVLAKGIAELGVDPRRLTFELIEHVTARDELRAAMQMRRLKELGIRLSLDDFGTGYSTLTSLKKLPLDEVKIDGSFVRDIENGDNDRALVKTMLTMANNLRLITVAEHVENVRQEAYLRAFGCDFFQGFLYSPALTEADFFALVYELPFAQSQRAARA